MQHATLIRLSESEQGTIGLWLLDGKPLCVNIELPWRDNRPTFSRIPAGRYRATWVKTVRHGMAYLLHGVPGRSAILVHSGNVAGDREKGMISHSYGCLLPGMTVGVVHGQKAVLNSATAVRLHADALKREPFTLDIIERF